GDDPAGQQAELVGGIADHQGVTGIVPALESDHDVGTGGKPVDDLALAFIAPLGTDHGNVGHRLFLLLANARGLGGCAAKGKREWPQNRAISPRAAKGRTMLTRQRKGRLLPALADSP